MSRPLSRRGLLAGLVPAAGRVRQEVFLASPYPGVAVMAYAYYTSATGGDMISIEQRWSRSDTIDIAYQRTSHDHGKTWSPPLERPTGEKRPDGMLRRHLRGGWVDPPTGRYLEFWLEGVLANDDPLEGLRQWRICYRIAGGPVRQLIHKGAGYSSIHPLPGVHTGKNCAMIGDVATQPLSLPDGGILLPVDISPLDAHGALANPGGGYTYHDVAVLHGAWKGAELEWTLSPPVHGDPARSTRGLSETSIARLSKNRLMMVMRGSNDRQPDLPSYRWISYSEDGGWTWSTPAPWTYNDGSSFYSPSSCSQLLSHSNGRLYWLGNITAANPRGNRPRYPFWIGEVDRDSGLLMRDRLRMIDNLQPGEDPLLSLSNFYAREDRQTHEICLHMTRLFASDKGWRGDAMLYRIAVS